MIADALRRLRSDTRGAIALAPVFVIVAVIVIATMGASLATASATSARSSAEQNMASAARTAVAAIQADMNGRGAQAVREAIGTQTVAGEYIPWGYLPSDVEKIFYLELKEATPGVWQLTFQVGPKNGFGKMRTYNVEYTQVPLLNVDGTWVKPTGAQVPTRLVWEPTRTIPGA